jgi:hypothetical protein
MNNKSPFEQKIEATSNSFDRVTRAEPKPFLLTRINARLHAKQESIWDKILYFISRPSIAIAAVCIVIAVNIFAIANGDNSNATYADDLQNAYTLDGDDDVAANTMIFDNENIEP